jgi:acyl-CoA reductase-like NAD-dependent aldehyde dehydrogenase
VTFKGKPIAVQSRGAAPGHAHCRLCISKPLSCCVHLAQTATNRRRCGEERERSGCALLRHTPANPFNISERNSPVLATVDTKPTGLLINGEIVDASSGEHFDVINPATGKTVGTAWQAGKEDVAAAVQAAVDAHADRRWRDKSADERSRIMWRLGELIERDAEELAALDTEMLGAPLAATRAMVAGASEAFRYYAGWCTKIHGVTSDLQAPGAPGFGHTLRQPVGPAGLITPWNFPVLAVGWKLAPALAAGCTAVIKPSEETPLSTFRVGQLALEAGVPPGVFNVVTGDGRTGAEIVAHPDIRKISFTGSAATGKRIVAQASNDLKRVTLELGGKSPLVICADADLDKAAQMAAAVMWGNSGQVCVAGSRLFIERPIFDQMVERIAAIVKSISPGDPTDPSTMMGPLVSAKQLAKVSELVESGRLAGATILTGGRQIERDGFYYPPTLLTDVTPDMRVMREEIFGPVVCATPFDDLDSVMPQLNDTEFGLGAYIWTRDIRTAHRFATEVEAGAIFVNTHGGYHYSLPFGGLKQSGWGREHGEDGLNAFLETKKVTYDLS